MRQSSTHTQQVVEVGRNPVGDGDETVFEEFGGLDIQTGFHRGVIVDSETDGFRDPQATGIEQMIEGVAG